MRPEWNDVEFALRARYPTLFQLSRLVQNGTLTPERALTILGYEGYEPQDARAMVDAWQAGKTAADKDLAKGEFLTLYEGRMIDSSQAETFLAGLGYDSNEVTLLLELADARRVRKFLEAAIGKIHSLYIGHRITRDVAVNELDSLGLTSGARDDNLALWDHEREVNLPVLTPAQLAAAVTHGAMTAAEALAELEGRGYSELNARRFLAGHNITV